MDKKVEKFIEENSDWYVEANQLVAGFEFKDFEVVKAKVSQIMELVDEIDHHPEVTFSYKTIEVKTCTHEAGNQITDKDFELAKQISKIVAGK